jgi:hypothetical protein
MAKERSFLGTGWGFPPTFVRGQGVVMTSDEDDVRASLEILLATEVGERVMQPRYGCNLHRLLFEPLDLTLRTYMKDLIRTAILYFEPRVILDDVTFELVSAEGRIDLRVDYTIAKTNARNNFVYPFYLVEGSQVER